MNLAWVKSTLQSGTQIAAKHAPGILMGMGTVGVGTAVYISIKAGPKALYLIDEAEKEKGYKDLTLQEKIKAAWKVYIPPVGIAAFSVLCFWAAHGIDLKRQAVVAGLYSTAEATFQEYQKKVIEVIGKEKHDLIREAVGEERIEKNPPPQQTPPAMPGVGGTDIWCNLYGKSFPSTYIKIKEAQNAFNQEMLTDGSGFTKSEAELYMLLDPSGNWLRPTQQNWDAMWSVDKLLYLHVDNPFGPILNVSYEDKNGLENRPKPSFML